MMHKLDIKMGAAIITQNTMEDEITFNNKLELHIFCVWEYYALEKSTQLAIDSIIEGVGRYKKYEALWNKKEAQTNLARIYKSSIPDAQKLKIVVNNRFAIFVVEDREPSYSFQETTTCVKEVNTNMLRAKENIRKLTGNKFGAHGTDCAENRECPFGYYSLLTIIQNISFFSPKRAI